MAQAVSRWPLAAEVWVRTRSFHVEFVAEKVAMGQVFLPFLQLSPADIIPPWLFHISPGR
jgi:hypothetical protein